MVVGRLEEAEAGATEGQPPAEVEYRGIRGNMRQQKAAGTHHQQARAAEDAGMDAPGERAGQGGDEHHHEGPGSHHSTGTDRVHPEGVQQHEGHADQDHHLGGVGDNAGDHRHREQRTAQQVEGQHRVAAAELGADVDRAEDYEQDSGGYYDRDADIVRVHLDAADQETEDGGVEQGVADVEPAALDVGRIVREEAPAHEEGEDTDRDVDGEEPGPVRQ